jgi:peptidoglycan/xylan/chitin deacetylase (PgdA/CDA1 family)
VKPMTRTSTADRLDRTLGRSPIQAYFRWRASRSVAVLAYHTISDAHRFEAHLEYLRRHCAPVSLQEVTEALAGRHGLPRQAVLVTFDDADRTLLEVGMPLLAEMQIPSVAFVVAGLVDSTEPFWWNEAEELVRAGGVAPGLEGFTPAETVRHLKRVPEDRRQEAMLELRRTSAQPASSQPQLRRAELGMLESAGIAIGNHTATHPCLPRCSDEQVRREIEEAHATLTDATGEPMAFAYPNGDWDARAAELLQQLDYRAGFLFDHALVRLPVNDRFRVSRVRVDSTTSMERFRLTLSGLHPAIYQARMRRTGRPLT